MLLSLQNTMAIFWRAINPGALARLASFLRDGMQCEQPFPAEKQEDFSSAALSIEVMTSNPHSTKLP